MRVSGLFIALVFIFLASHGMAEDSQEDVPSDIEFLEFLGRWETKDGDWIDPLSLGTDLQKTGEGEGMKGAPQSKKEDDLIRSSDNDASPLKKGKPSIKEQDEDE